MIRSLSVQILLGLLLAGASLAAEKPSQSAVILRVEKKAHVRTLYYLHNTPVETEDPYYEMTVQSDGIQYTAEYEPRNADEALPDECTAGQEARLKIEKREFYLLLPGRRDMKWSITKRKPAPPEAGPPTR